MKWIVILMFTMGFAFAQDTATEILEEQVESVYENVLECEEGNESCEEDQIRQFILTEVIPSFEEFKEIRPSFSITFNERGMVLNTCSLGLTLKQSRVINYIFSEESVGDIETNMEIGQPAYISLNLSCEDYNSTNSEQNFKLMVSFQDEEFTPTSYGLKVISLNQEQAYFKLWSFELDVSLQEQVNEMGVDSRGSVLPLAELESSLQEWTPLTVESTLRVSGVAQLSVPVAVEGEREETQSTVKVEGAIYFSDTGEIVPDVDFSME